MENINTKNDIVEIKTTEEGKETIPQSEKTEELNIEKNSIENNSISKSPEELNKIEELLKEINKISEVPNLQSENKKNRVPDEIEIINGKQYKVFYVPKEEIYPAFGYARGYTSRIREDLSPRVKRFVKAHELYHCTDKANWGGVFGSELRANLIPGLKDPLGLIATVWKTISDKDRIDFYLKRVKGGY